MTALPPCKICGTESSFFDKADILHKHHVTYFRCPDCGFIQTEEPYWLGEAYSSAISQLDTGILDRNLMNRQFTCAVLNALFPDAHCLLDYGAGHGIFVRLMRDMGFNFFWFDLHASNDYARGFEHEEGRPYAFATCFEVLEHLVSPLTELSTLMAMSPNVFVSTVLLPDPVPRVTDWWYYTTASGQHVSFYTLEALRRIAKRFGRHLLSHGPYHLFTKEPKSAFTFRVAMSHRLSPLMNLLHHRPSLKDSDFELMAKE